MRKAAFALSFLLALLCGCAPPAPAEPESPPEASPATSKAEFLPALTPLVELSTPAETAEGRAQGNYELPKKMFYDPVTEDDFPALLAELPEANAAFYGLDWDKALSRWGDSVAEFDWPWLTPRQILPRLYCFDLDHDWEDELIVVCHPGTGTGVSIDDLHVLEKNLDGTLDGLRPSPGVLQRGYERSPVRENPKRANLLYLGSRASGRYLSPSGGCGPGEHRGFLHRGYHQFCDHAGT